LTRDHVIPISRGGGNKWENVVAACKRCNWLKDCQTPEEASMPLLAVPFKPNTYEWHYLAKERVLADQMAYLSQQFKAKRDWAN
jgi:5-methylcytosine-specific restriction endonuclease McrA